MLRLLGGVAPGGAGARLYGAAAADTHSLPRAAAAAAGAAGAPAANCGGGAAYATIPRAREVGEGLLAAAAHTLLALARALPLVARFGPDLVLVNGPGSCLPVCAAALLLRVRLAAPFTPALPHTTPSFFFALKAKKKTKKKRGVACSSGGRASGWACRMRASCTWRASAA